MDLLVGFPSYYPQRTQLHACGCKHHIKPVVHRTMRARGQASLPTQRTGRACRMAFTIAEQQHTMISHACNHFPSSSSLTNPKLTITPVAAFSATFLASAPSWACVWRKCVLSSFALAIYWHQHRFVPGSLRQLGLGVCSLENSLPSSDVSTRGNLPSAGHIRWPSRLEHSTFMSYRQATRPTLLNSCQKGKHRVRPIYQSCETKTANLLYIRIQTSGVSVRFRAYTIYPLP
jgi:hypothetical protein